MLSWMIGTPLMFRKVRNYVRCILVFVASTWLQGEKWIWTFIKFEIFAI